MSTDEKIPPHLRSDVERMRAAYQSEDWQEVVELAGAMRAGSLPPDVAAEAALLAGRSLFFLGRNQEALRHLEEGLGSPSLPEELERAEFAYFAGMAAMMAGDLDRARSHLHKAVEQGAAEHWVGGAAGRGLAQVEIELGNLQSAVAVIDRIHSRMGPHPFGLMLSARAQARMGEDAVARLNLLAAREMAGEPEPGAAPSESMTLASIHTGVAEVYLELGHADAALAALETVEKALEEAGRPAIPAAAFLPVFRAGAFRLSGRLGEAERLLEQAQAPPECGEDLFPTILRERARVAADAGRLSEARALWDCSAEGFEAMGYRWQAEASRREIRDGPPGPRPQPDPQEDMLHGVGDFSPADGIVVTLRVSGDDYGSPEEQEALLALGSTIGEALSGEGIGVYDGWEAGGGTFSFYFRGDPDLVWPCVEPRLPPVAARLGGEVRFLRDGVETGRPLGHGGAEGARTP